tara:strand:- start:600 stop:1301 length:702 start_codon:yes stop_codon:yes gene_type:complete
MFLASNTQIELPNNGECQVCSKLLYGQQRKFCSTECGVKFHNAEGKSAKIEAPRSCVHCSVEFFKSQTGLLNYCSNDCQKQALYKNNKNPFSTYGSGKHKQVTQNKYNSWVCCAYDEAVIDNDVLDHIEYLATDEPYVQEDLEWLERVLREEQTGAFYEDGTPYRPEPVSFKLRMDPKCWWWKKPNLAIRRKKAWWTRQYFGTLNERAVKMRLRKMKYGKRKKFMALVKVKST